MTIRDLSIKAKVNLVAIAVSTSVLMLAIVLFLFHDAESHRDQIQADLSTQAQILGANSGAAVAFADAAAAAEILSALRVKPEVRTALLYDTHGRVFARYPATADADLATIRQAGTDLIEVEQEITFEGRRLGRLYLASDLREVHARARRSLAASGGLLVVAALLAYLLSGRLHGLVTTPIARLRESMLTVSASGNYEVRVEKTGADDFGQLIDCFNHMLDEVHRRDETLQQVNLQLEARRGALEQEVAERARAERELKALTETLEERVAERSAAVEHRAQALARSEERLRQQTEMLQSVLHSMGDGVIVADEGGEIRLYNEAAADILHLDPQQPATLDWRLGHVFLLPDMVTPCPADAFPVSRAVRGAAVDGTELYVPASGARQALWLSANARPLLQAGGQVVSAVVVFRDITEQKRVEAALVRARDAAEEASRAKSAFLANMSHELRTPLNAIIGYSELLEETAGDNGHDEYTDDLRRVQSAGKHLLALINDVLDLSKIEAGRMDVLIEEFSVAPALTELVNTIHPLAEKKRNRLLVSVDPAVGTMASDLTKVRQVLFNLLSNACKFTEDGDVTLSAHRVRHESREWIEFSVRDTGIGISPEQSGQLFQDFAQADASTTRKYGGTGLGLAISRRFCQMLGGTIDLSSESGLGSTFTVRLPATVRRAAALAAPAPSSAGVHAAPGEVLVIDDDPAARQLIARHLQREGLRAVLASSGAEGLALARQRRPLAITLDVLMPSMDGWAVLSALKSDPTLADVPVIMLTILGEEQTGYALGAAAYVQKPIEPEQLAAALRSIGLGGSPGGHVLVVDDDEVTRALLRRHFEAGEWTVATVADGREALAVLSSVAPDVILLDLMMPNMDGFQFLEELRKAPSAREVPVIVISAKDLSGDERARLNGNVVRVIHKHGATCEALLPEVGRLVRAAMSRREAA